jgi:hypothetical protein
MAFRMTNGTFGIRVLLFRPSGAGYSVGSKPTADAVGCILPPLRGWAIAEF